MKTNKKIAILLTFALLLNMFCAFNVFAEEDAQITISGAVTEVLIGTKTEEGRTPALASTGFSVNSYSLTSTGAATADFTVYSPVEAVYKLSLCYGGVTSGTSSNINLNVYVDDGSGAGLAKDAQKLGTETIKATENDDSMTWATVGAHGSIKLNAGVNTIRFERTNSGASFKFHAFKLETVSKTNTVEIGTGSMTINSGSSGCGTSSRNRITMNEGGQFSLNVYPIDAGNYKLYVDNESGVATNMSYSVGTADAVAVDVDAVADFQYLGVVALKADKNTITLKNNNNTEFKIRKIKLEYTDEKIYASNDMTGEVKEFVFRTNAVNDIGVTGGNCSENNNSITLNRKDEYIEYTVVPTEDGVYDVSLNCDALNGAVTIQMLLNDVVQGEITIASGTNSRSYRYIDSIALTADEASKITFKNITDAGTQDVNSSMDKFKLEKTDKVYSVSPITLKNIKTNGLITLKKYVHSDDEWLYIAAKYTKSGDTKLMKDCLIRTISLAETSDADVTLAINEPKDVSSSRFDISEVIEGEIIEVFLIDLNDYTPIIESVEYTYTAADVEQAAN